MSHLLWIKMYTFKAFMWKNIKVNGEFPHPFVSRNDISTAQG